MTTQQGRVRGKFGFRIITCSGNAEVVNRHTAGETYRPAGHHGQASWRSRRLGEDRKRKETRCQQPHGRGRGSTAGFGRAEEQGSRGGEASEERREKEERQRKKGKGVGERIPEKEPKGEEKDEKEKEEEERKRGGRPLKLILEQQRIGQRWRGEDGVVKFEPSGTPPEEVGAGPGGSASAFAEACQATDGPGCGSADNSSQWSSWRCEDDQLLQPPPEALLLYSEQGHEGAVSAGNSHRRAEAGSLRSAGGFLCEPVHSDPDCHGRWQLEERPVLGDAPAGEQQPSANASFAAGSEACKGGGSQPSSGRWWQKRKLERFRSKRTVATGGERKRQGRKRKRQGEERKRKGQRLMGLRRPRRRMEQLEQPVQRQSGLVEQQEGRQGWQGWQKQRGSEERRMRRRL